MRREKLSIFLRNSLIIVGILLIFLLVGFWLLKEGHERDEYLEKPENTYSYRIYVQPIDKIIYLSEAYIKQDFSNNKGEFSFATIENESIEAIQIWLPNITSSPVRCYNKSRNDFYNKENLIDIKCNVLEIKDNYVEIKFNKKVFNNEIIVITYPLSIIPNNRFDIFTIKEQVWNVGVQGNFIIKLGKNFECVGDCLYNLRYINLTKKIYGVKEFHLTFENYPNETQHSFEIITKSRKILDNKNVFISAGVALSIGVIFSIISFVIYLFQKQDNKSTIKKLRQTIYDSRRR